MPLSMNSSLITILLIILPLKIVTCSLSAEQPLCDHDCSALLQFKKSINISRSQYSCAYPEVIDSWKGCECCSWDGIECEENTGRVIGLDLTSSCLQGSLNSHSALFHLFQLRQLSLADNDFSLSKIPSEFGKLSRLSHLNLSSSAFSGQIPLEFLNLSRLVSLDLSGNFLELKNPGFGSLVGELRNLQVLDLNKVNISSAVPRTLGNLSSLRSLFLQDCGLHGEFPMEVFHLPNLQSLKLRFNGNLTGYLPQFPSDRPLQVLDIGVCNFSGPIPSSIGNLATLTSLVLGANNFSGKIPSSLGNLTQLTYLDLEKNDFYPGTLSWLKKLTKLTTLGLAQTNLYGHIPSSVGNLTRLTELDFGSNQLTGDIPSSLGNLTHLTILGLDHNKLNGSIPQSIKRLKNLETLYLNNNDLLGEVNFDLFLDLKDLAELQLSQNHLSVVTKSNFSLNTTTPKFIYLGLVSCNLKKFPDFLQTQDKLEMLQLTNNQIHGQVPKWMLNVSTSSLLLLDFSKNFVTGFESNQSPIFLPWTNLVALGFEDNLIEGSLPIPPASVMFYLVDNNELTGEISTAICNLTSILFLDLSSNSLGGMLPQCLGELINSSLVLNLKKNRFHGKLPQMFKEGCALRAIDLSENQLEGKVPKSLANCSMLEYLNLGRNHVSDIFPDWLGSLENLKVLLLPSNEFHGAIGNPKNNSQFSMLHIIDLSSNRFTGKLPSRYIQLWNTMKCFDPDKLRYLIVNTHFKIPFFSWNMDIPFTMILDNKGTETLYEKIQDFLVAIDLSDNRFDGPIPEVIGTLNALRLLNLSNNILDGHIPSSLGSLSQLESLDLSHNKLSGDIPQELVRVTSLEKLDVSYNDLVGPIPHGNQFDTFENSSYEGNQGLCGKPLSRECGNSAAASPGKDEGSNSIFEFGWKVVMMGYGTGLIVGMITGYFFIDWNPNWLTKIYGLRPVRRRRS